MGTLWPVTDRAAAAFAQAFYEWMRQGLPIGEAMRRARQRVRERYPNGEVRVEREVLQDEDGNYVNHGAWKLFDSKGRLLAGGIAGAEFVELDSRNHILLEHEPAWSRFCEAVLSFVNADVNTDADVFAALSAREREVLALIADGLSNARIAERLQIGEKTVRNHASNLFDKLGVRSRTQAIVFAHEHGFRHEG